MPSFFMTVKNTAWRDVYRPTMNRELKTPGNKGTEVVMHKVDHTPPGPEPEPIRKDLAVLTAAEWAFDNNYTVGEVVRAFVALYEGGADEGVVYRYRWQTKAVGDADWTNGKWVNYNNVDTTIEYTLTADGTLRFQCQARDASVDPVDQVNSFTSSQTVSYPALVVGTPKASGEPIVGYTLNCSEPSIEGGSGSTQVNYYWRDANNQTVLYMGPTQVVQEVDITRTVECQVAVIDTVSSESATVVSNALGPIQRPIIPEFDVWVDDSIYNDPDQPIVLEPGGSVVMEVRQQPASNPPADMAYKWQIRTGKGRLSGDENSTGIIYIAPEEAPAGALVTCTVSSVDAQDNAQAAEVSIIVEQ